MTGVDSSELILLLIIGLIVLGPKRLPEIANKVGTWVGHARRMTRSLKRQLEEELRFEDKPGARAPVVPPRSPTAATGPMQVDEKPAAHTPNDDDTYSPLHEPEVNDDEKSA